MKPFSLSMKVASVYAILGSLWIIFSDIVIGYVSYPEASVDMRQTIKGLLFIVVTAILLFLLIRSMDAARTKEEGKVISAGERYKALFDNAPVPMWYFDPETLQFLDVNTVATVHYGYSKDEFLSMTLKDIRPPETIPQLLIDVTTNPNEPYYIFAQHLRKDGVVLDVEVFRQMVKLNGESVMLAMVLDRTEAARLERERSAAEFAFRESAQEALLLASVVEGSLDIIALHEPDGKILYITPSIANTLGYEPSEVTGRNIIALCHPEDIERAEVAIRSVLAGMEQQVTYRIQHKNGHYIWLESKLKPILAYGGQEIIRFEAFSRDVTDRKRAEEQLKMLSMVASKTSNVVIITDAIGYITWVNEGFTNITEFTGEEAIGKKPGEILQGANTSPETIQQMSQAISAGQAFEVEVINYTKAGWEYWIHIKADPFFDETGILQGFIAIEQDITHEKEQAEELMQSYMETQNFRTALETSAMVSMTDPDGTIVYANEAFSKVSKYPLEELFGKNHRIINSGYHSEEFFRQMWATISSGKSWRGEIRNRAKDGSYYWVETAINPMFDQHGQIYQYVSVRYEITERKRIEEELKEWSQVLERRVMERTHELQELNHEKDEILGIAAHDLKNPLAGILSSAEILKHYYAQDEKVKRFSTLIINASDQMLGIIKNLLEINHIESGKVTMNLRSVSLEVVVPIIEDYEQRSKTKDIHVLYEPQPGTLAPVIMADEQVLWRIVDNIISNAVKYSPREKNIYVRVQSRTDEGGAEYGRVEVQDEGPGISAEDKKKLFGKFARLSAAPTGGESSTGLGLSIVKKLTEGMNGKVWCESELGRGATFIVEFPIAHDESHTV